MSRRDIVAALSPLKYGVNFENFKTLLTNHTKVLVVGPQRSGTHFAAKAVAHDTDYEFLDEDLLRTKAHGFRGLKKLLDIARNKNQWVIQATDVMVDINNIPKESKIFIIVMVRHIADIIKSQQGIQWGFEQSVKNIYRSKYAKLRLDKPISEIRYDVWHNRQKKLMECEWMELDYNSMSAHPLWVAPEKRPDRIARRKKPKGAIWTNS